MKSSSITFSINGKIVELNEGEFDPMMKLSDFLRSDQYFHLIGTKIGCGEGGCGACTVIMSNRSSNGAILHRSVNSCLILMIQVHLTVITTIEFLGNIRDGINPIQDSFIRHHATQCGFCTPGFIMSAYCAFLNNDKINPINDGNTNFDIEETHQLDGNLCRCTGYRPIIDALREFQKNPIEPCDGSISVEQTKFEKYNLNERIPVIPDSFENIRENFNDKAYIEIHKSSNIICFIPSSLESLYKIKKKCINEKKICKIIVGSTEISVDLLSKPLSNVKDQIAYISTFNLSDLNHISFIVDESTNQKKSIKIGANTPINFIGSFLSENENYFKSSIELQRFSSQFLQRIEQFGSNQIRNVASLVGNIAHGGAATDFSNFLLAMKAMLKCYDVLTNESFIKRMDNDFYTGYRKTSLKESEIILDIEIPLPQHNEFISTFKQGRRREDDICIVSSTIFVKIDSDIINDIRIAYSGMSASPCRATKIESFLKGKPFTIETFTKSFELNILKEEFPLDEKSPGGLPHYRYNLAKSFLFRFFHQTQRDRNKLYDISAAEQIDSPPKKKFEIHGCKHKEENRQQNQEDISGQHLSKANEVGFPNHHLTAAQQVTGEAIFVDDIICPNGTLHAAFVRSSIPHGKILSVDFSEALKVHGVIDKITKDDIHGTNFDGNILQDEPVFADKEVHYVGQPIALIIAKSDIIARDAAKLVKVEYEALPTVLSIDQAIQTDSFYPFDNFIEDGDVSILENRDDNNNNQHHVIEGEVFSNGQSHFYLEPCSTLVEYHEDDNLTIYSTTQNPTMIQSSAAKVNGIPSNKINVVIKRVGGAFGGKETRPTVLSNAASIAALKLRRSIKLTLNRQEDMSTQGQRHPCLTKFKVRFLNDGKIEAVSLNIYLDCGWSLDMSASVGCRLLLHASSAYKVPNFLARVHLCRTNMITCTAFRGFGTPQAMVSMESVIESIARYLHKNPEEVKYINLFSNGDTTPFKYPLNDCRVRECWDKIISEKKFNLLETRRKIDEFNKNHKYKKRGLSLCPLVFGISYSVSFLNQGFAQVNIYQDGSVKIFHGGCEMGQGINTKVAQIAATVLDIPMKYIEVAPSTTDHTANASPTSASMGSDLNGTAVMNACKKLNERLKSFRESTKSWEEACLKAYLSSVDLSEHGYMNIPGVGFDWSKREGRPYKYYSYGCNAAEVEIDLLTGDHQILRDELILDIGKSLNEALDIGQIEGGLMQGIGWLTTEDVIRGDENNKWLPPGFVRTNGPGFYKIPTGGDLPHHLSIEILEDGRNPDGIFSSKACSESPLCLAVAVGMAIVDAIHSANADGSMTTSENDQSYNNNIGFDLKFPMSAPRIKQSLKMNL